MSNQTSRIFAINGRKPRRELIVSPPYHGEFATYWYAMSVSLTDSSDWDVLGTFTSSEAARKFIEEKGK